MEYTKDYPDTDIILAINSIPNNSEPEIMTSIVVSGEESFVGIMSYLENCYYAEAEFIEVDFPEESRFVDYWMGKDGSKFSEN